MEHHFGQGRSQHGGWLFGRTERNLGGFQQGSGRTGQIEDFAIYRSELESSGDVNLFLVTKFANSAQLEPNKERYDAFMKAWGEANEDRTREITKNYPGMRNITGEYIVREITIK